MTLAELAWLLTFKALQCLAITTIDFEGDKSSPIVRNGIEYS